MLDYLKKYTAQYPYLVRIGVPITIGQLGVIVLGFADTFSTRIGCGELRNKHVYACFALRTWLFLWADAYHWETLWAGKEGRNWGCFEGGFSLGSRSCVSVDVGDGLTLSQHWPSWTA